MQQQIARLLATALLAAGGTALACGDYVPTRGGQMNDDGGETAMELVHRNGEVLVYLEDHGTAISTDGVYGVLRVKQGGKTVVATLLPAGGNALTAQLPRALREGESLSAQVNLRGGDVATGTFQYAIGGDAKRAEAAKRFIAQPTATR